MINSDQDFVSNYTRINLLPQVLRINGVGGVSVLGSEYSIRVWLKPDVMAQYSLKPSDITTAIGEQSIESPTGILGDNSGNTFQYTMKYRGRFETPEEYENIIIRSLSDGEILRLKDVATVELGALNYAMNVQSNGHPGTVLTIQQSAGSNATEISQALDKLLDEVVPSLPPGMEVKKLLDVNDFLDASIKNICYHIVACHFVSYYCGVCFSAKYSFHTYSVGVYYSFDIGYIRHFIPAWIQY